MAAKLAPFRQFNTELLRVLGVQSLPALELHCFGTRDGSDRISIQEQLQHIERDVPARRTHRDVVSIDDAPERQTRAATNSFQLPAHVVVARVVLEHFWRLGSRYFRFDWRGRSDPRKLHDVAGFAKTAIDLEGRPIAKLRGIGQRLPDFIGRVTELFDENQRPLFSVFFDARHIGWTWGVLPARAHLRSPCFPLRGLWWI